MVKRVLALVGAAVILILFLAIFVAPNFFGSGQSIEASELQITSTPVACNELSISIDFTFNPSKTEAIILWETEAYGRFIVLAEGQPLKQPLFRSEQGHFWIACTDVPVLDAYGDEADISVIDIPHGTMVLVYHVSAMWNSYPFGLSPISIQILEQ